MSTPSRNDSISRKTNGSKYFSPRIFIYTEDPIPSFQSQVPFSIPFTISFPRHSGPPFVQVLTHPFFDRHFSIQVRIRKFVRTFNLVQTTNEAPPPYSSYVFFIYITPCNLTHRAHSHHRGTSAAPLSSELPQQPPITTVNSTKPRNSSLVPQPRTPLLFNVDPTPRVPLRTQTRFHPFHPSARIERPCKPPLDTRQQRSSHDKPLPPPFYHLRPLTYHTTDTVTYIPALSPIIEDNTSSASAPVAAAEPTRTSLRRMLQRVWRKLRRNERHRHGLFVFGPFVVLTLPLHTDPKLLERHRHVLVYDDGLPFPLDYSIAAKPENVPLSFANDRIRSPPICTCERSLAVDTNANQITQDTPENSQPSQPGRALPHYAPSYFFTDYATYYLSTSPYAPTITFLPTRYDEFILISIMLNNHGLFTYFFTSLTSEKARLTTPFDTNLTLKIYLNFCWSPCLRKSESKIELAKIVNDNLDLEIFQGYLLTDNLATRLIPRV